MPDCPSSEPKTGTALEEFFFRLLASWRRSTDNSDGPFVKRFSIGELPLTLKFATSGLATSLGRIFQFFPEPENEAPGRKLTIHVFDGLSAVDLPRFPWNDNAFQARGELCRDPESPILASYLTGPDILSLYHSGLGQAIYWIRNGNRVPAYEQAAPFRHLIHWWLREFGHILVHGAGISDADKGLLLIGRGGSGKSTLAVAALARGLSILGDDYCALGLNRPHHCYAVYPSAKLTEKSYRMIDMPDLSPSLVDDRKKIIFLNECRPCGITRQFPLRGIVLPCRGKSGKPLAVRPMSQAETARHLAASTLFQMAHAGPREFSSLAGIARTVPGWRLEMIENDPLASVTGLQRILNENAG